jgi:hypothetical protein
MKNKLIESPFLFPLSNGNSRKVYKAQTIRRDMKKNLASKLRTGAMIGLAGLALGATAPKANATTGPIAVTTTISPYNVDQDSLRDGIQIRYDWAVQNNTGLDFENDVLFKYVVDTDLLNERQMYGFINSGSDWSTHSTENSFYWLADQVGNVSIDPTATKTFSAFIDQNLIIGNEQVQSYGMSNNGQSEFSNATVPIAIPEATTVGALLTGAAALLAGRRVKEHYRYR